MLQYIQAAKSEMEWVERIIKRLEAKDLLLKISGKRTKNTKRILQAEKYLAEIRQCLNDFP